MRFFHVLLLALAWPLPLLAQEALDFEEVEQVAEPIPCFSCELIKGVVEVGVSLGEPTFEYLRGGLITLIAIVMALMLLWHAGRILMPFGSLESGRKTLNSIVVMIGMGLFTIGALTSLQFAWRYLYAPTLTASMGISDAVLAASTRDPAADCDRGAFQSEDMTERSQELGERLACRIEGISTELNNGMRLGWAMFVSTKAPQYKLNLFKPKASVMRAFVRLLLIISGIMMAAVFLYATAAFLFAIIDVIMRWTFLFVMSPLMLAAFTFPQTRGFSTFGLKGLAEAMMTLVLMSVVASVTSVLITEIGTNPDNLATATPDIEGYILGIANATMTPPTLNTEQFGKIMIIGLLAGTLIFKIRGVSASLVGGGLALGVAGAYAAGVLNENTFKSAMNQTMGRGGNMANTANLDRRLVQEQQWQAKQQAARGETTGGGSSSGTTANANARANNAGSAGGTGS